MFLIRHQAFNNLTTSLKEGYKESVMFYLIRQLRWIYFVLWNRGMQKAKKAFPQQVMRTEDGGWNIGLPSFLWHLVQLGDGKVVSSAHLTHFTPKEIPWYSFLLEAEWTPGLLNADKRNRSLENFRGSSRNWTQDLLSCGAVPQPTASLISDKTVKT